MRPATLSWLAHARAPPLSHLVSRISLTFSSSLSLALACALTGTQSRLFHKRTLTLSPSLSYSALSITPSLSHRRLPSLHSLPRASARCAKRRSVPPAYSPFENGSAFQVYVHLFGQRAVRQLAQVSNTHTHTSARKLAQVPGWQWRLVAALQLL